MVIADSKEGTHESFFKFSISMGGVNVHGQIGQVANCLWNLVSLHFYIIREKSSWRWIFSFAEDYLFVGSYFGYLLRPFLWPVIFASRHSWTNFLAAPMNISIKEILYFNLQKQIIAPGFYVQILEYGVKMIMVLLRNRQSGQKNLDCSLQLVRWSLRMI